jgi:predicted component of type VI protein secretion system
LPHRPASADPRPSTPRNHRVNVSLVMVKADGSSKEVVLGRTSTLIGRDESARLRIPLPSVSRKHCLIEVQGSELVIKDLGSSNGTYVNGRRVRETELEPGDLLCVGPVVFVVRIDGQPAQIDAKDCYAAGSVGFDDDDDEGPPPGVGPGSAPTLATSTAPGTTAAKPPSPPPTARPASPSPPPATPVPPARPGPSVDDDDDDDVPRARSSGSGGKKPLLGDEDEDQDISQLLKDFSLDDEDDDTPKKK